MKSMENFKELKKDILTHKKTLKEDNSENQFKKTQIDKFFSVVKSNINEVSENDNLSDVEKESRKIKLIELAENKWEESIKIKYTAERSLLGEKRRVNQEWYDNFFKEERGELDQELLVSKANEIKKIPFDGKLETPKDFNNLIVQFDDAISDLEWNGRIKEGAEKKEIEKAIDILKGHKSTIKKLNEQTQNFDMDKLDSHYNNAIDEVVKFKGNGALTIELFGISQPYRNKSEALSALKIAKTELYEEFKSGWRSSLEVLLLYVGSIINGVKYTFLDKSALPLTKDGLTNIRSLEPLSMLGGAIQGVVALGLGVVGISVLATVGGMHGSVGESIYRRGFKDPLGYLGFMQYEDYGKTGNMFENLDTDEGKEYLEYKQRESLTSHFKQKLKAFNNTSKEYKILKDNISILEDFKLNKTNTFYYIANKISKDMKLGVMGNLDLKTLGFNLKRTLLDGGKIIGYNPLKKNADGDIIKGIRKDGKWELPRLGGFESHIIDRTQNLYSDTMNMLKEMDDDLTEGVKTFYKNKVVETVTENNSIKTNIEGNDEKTKKYQNIIDYIKNQSISDTKKEKLIKKFDRYIEKLGKDFQYPKNIYKDIILLLNVDFQEPNDQLKKLTKKIEEIEEKFGLKESVQEKTPFIKKGNQKYNNYKDFRSLIAAGDWVGTKEEYDKAIIDIEAGNKISANITHKIGTTDVENKFNDIITEGEKSLEHSKILRKKLFDSIGTDLENSNKTQLLRNIEDYISYKIDNNSVEKSVKNELRQYLEKVISGDILIGTENKLYIEIGTIIKGGLTEYKLINKLSDSLLKSFNDDQRQKVKDLIQEIIDNPKTIITEKEINKIINEIENNNLDLAKIEHSNKIDLTLIKTDIDSSEDMRKRDINSKLDEISSDKKEYISDIKKTVDIDDSIINKDEVKFELDKLQDSLRQGSDYTHLQILHIIDEIKNGKKFDNISKTIETSKYSELNELIKPTSLKSLENSIDNIERNLSDVDNIKALDELNKKIEILKSNKFFGSLDKNHQDKLSDNFIKAQEEVLNIFKAKSINEQIDITKKNQNYLSDFKKSKIKEFVNIIITTINELESTTEKISKAELLKNSLTNDDIYTTRVKENIDNILKLKGISNLEKTFQGYKNQFENGNLNDKRKEKILENLDKLSEDKLVNDKLRAQVEELKTEINDSMDTDTGSKTPAPETTKETTTDFEKTKVKNIQNLYTQAALYLEVHGDFDKADKLLADFINFDEKSVNNEMALSKLETKIKKEIGISLDEKMPSLSKLKTELTRLTNELKLELTSKQIDFSGKKPSDIRKLNIDLFKTLSKAI